MKRERPSEQELGAIVVAYLEAIGAEVFQEVECGTGVADIVARVGAELWIVEVKTSLSLALITQAMDRRREAHRIFIAAPYSRHQREVAGVCEELGIGMLDVRVGVEYAATSGYDFGAPAVLVVAESRRWNSRPVGLASRLKPEHKTHAKAGAVGAGGRWTPFRNTLEQLARVVSDEPGITLKDAIDKIKHHYSSKRSARSALVHWLQIDKVPRVRLVYGDGARLFPAETR